MPKLEICAANIRSAVNAQEAGADRIELCTDLSSGGLTPSYELIKEVSKELTIPIYVLIRPRVGDFIYQPKEIQQMHRDIQFCIEQQVGGVVFGVLKEDGTINLDAVHGLLTSATHIDVTFHRAFDLVYHHLDALFELIELGCQRILTSAGPGNAIDNLANLSELIGEAGEDLIIMPGGGVRQDNVLALLKLGAKEIHSSCLLTGDVYSSFEEIRSMKMLIESFQNNVEHDW